MNEKVDCFYSCMLKCPYIQKIAKECPFIKSQVENCPYLSQKLSEVERDNCCECPCADDKENSNEGVDKENNLHGDLSHDNVDNEEQSCGCCCNCGCRQSYEEIDNTNEDETDGTNASAGTNFEDSSDNLPPLTASVDQSGFLIPTIQDVPDEKHDGKSNEKDVGKVDPTNFYTYGRSGKSNGQ